MSKLVSIALAAAAAFAVVSTSTPLFAAEPALVYETAAVPYRDLNLASTDGQQQLHQRVRAAVRKVCGVERSPALNEHKVVQGCRTEAFASARPQVDKVLAGHRPQVIIAASR
jgi:UrcA family protein